MTAAPASPGVPRREATSPRLVRGWPRYAAARACGAVVSVFAMVVAGFFLFRVLPGDPVATMTYHHATTPRQVAALRRSLGFDRPLAAQFMSYLTHLLHGSLGTSFEYGAPVSSLMASHLWPTIYLAGTATALAGWLGIWLGMRSGWRAGSLADRVSTGAALTLWSAPTFWLGLVLLTVFGVGAGPIPGLFPTGGLRSPSVTGLLPSAVDGLRHLVLPCVTFAAVSYGQYVLLMRESMRAERGSAYLTTARAKGLTDATVRRRHAAANALLPTVTLIFLNLGQVIFCDVLVETVFSWPGLGTLFFDALEYPDFPLLEGLFIVFSVSVVGMNLVADLLYPLLDPRVRTT